MRTDENHEYFMRIALAEAEKSFLAGEFPVGCILINDGEVVAQARRINSIGSSANELDHAEVIALRTLILQNPDIDTGRLILYSTMEPCLMCFSTLILSGVKSVVFGYEDIMGGGTNLPLRELAPLYRQMKVKVVPHVLRQESLLLFKRYFENPANIYWNNSLLAEYTLAQKIA